MKSAPPKLTLRDRAWSTLRRTALLLLLWWVLTAGQPFGAWFAVLAVAAAAGSAWLLPPAAAPWAWRLSGLARFLPFFLLESLRGGFDVATRALKPSRPIDPAMLTATLRLQTDAAAIFLAHVVSLLPGTLSADLEGRILHVHVLSGSREAALVDIRRLETYISRLFAHEPPLAREEAP